MLLRAIIMPPFMFASISVGSILALVLHWLQRRSSFRSRRLPPLAPLGPWETLRVLAGPHLPFAYQQIQRQVGTTIYRLALPFGKQLYVVADQEAAMKILGDATNDKPAWFQATKGFTGGSPSIFSMLTRDPNWQVNRKRVAHAFAPSRLKPKALLLEEKLEPLYSLLDDHARTGTPVAIADFLLHLGLDFVSLSAFDYDLGTLQGGPHSEGRRFLEELDIVLTEFAVKRALAPWRKFLWWNAEVRRAKQASEWLRGLALRIMERYRQVHTPEEIATGDSILAHLLRNDNYPDDAARVGDVIAMLIGGHDTSSYTLAWALYDLARHPDIQHRLQKELDEAAKGSDSIPPSLLNQLNLLNSCLRETMRLWPIVASPTRELNQEMVHNGMTLPKKASCKIAFLAISRASWIPNADHYQPERWLDPSPALEGSVMPFSAGVRSCVGQNLANLQLRVTLAGIVRRFAFTVAREPEVEYNLTMHPKGLLLHVTRWEGAVA